jgi:hypothetical protein
MRSEKGRKRAKRKIGASLVLILEVKVSHAVDEGPKRGQKKIGERPVLFLEVT